tara:strand:- start:143 stop:643 length:501 start_codon:yes stop_codon:yes gene_type:complete
MRKNFIPPSNMSSSLKNDTYNNNTSTNKKPRNIATPTKEPKIIDQISSYNKKHTDVVFSQLKEEYYEQTQINEILKEKNFEENIKEINNFAELHSESIKTQINDMEELFNDFKKLFNENQTLHNDQSEYTEINNSKEIKDLSNDMLRLKTLKYDVLNFLEKNRLRN